MPPTCVRAMHAPAPLQPAPLPLTSRAAAALLLQVPTMATDAPPLPLTSLPTELIITIVCHVPHPADVHALLCCNRALLSLVQDPELQAAWLAAQHPTDALLRARTEAAMLRLLRMPGTCATARTKNGSCVPRARPRVRVGWHAAGAPPRAHGPAPRRSAPTQPAGAPAGQCWC